MTHVMVSLPIEEWDLIQDQLGLNQRSDIADALDQARAALDLENRVDRERANPTYFNKGDRVLYVEDLSSGHEVYEDVGTVIRVIHPTPDTRYVVRWDADNPAMDDEYPQRSLIPAT